MSREPLAKLEYTKGEDGMLYPNLQISVSKEYDLRPTGMFGRRWKDYMKSKHPQRLSELIALGQINELIAKVDKEAEAKKETLIQQLLDRGYAGESRTHGDDNQTGGGDHPARSSVPVKIAEKEEVAEPEPVKKNTEKASEESEAEHTAEGSSFHIPQSVTKENIREHKDWEEVQSLLTDTGIFPLELYDRINQVFAKETAPAMKRNAVRDIYLDYGLQKSSDGTRGIMPGKDVADFFFGEEGFVRLSWDVITHVIDFLMQNSEYIPYHEEEDAIGDFNIPDEIEDMQLGSRKDHEDGQLSLFELYPGPYEDDGKGGDQILLEETEPEEIKSGYMPFPVGSRIAYDDRIFEVLQYLDDNHTVELGDIEQLQGLHGYKVIERLPVVLIENAELLQPNYTEGEVAQTVVQSVEDKGLNYHYQPEHRLYEGGPKAKFHNNVEAIRLLKQLQQENNYGGTDRLSPFCWLGRSCQCPDTRNKKK